MPDPADSPSACEIGPDVRTAIVVSLRPVDAPRTDLGFSVQIHEVG